MNCNPFRSEVTCCCISCEQSCFCQLLEGHGLSFSQGFAQVVPNLGLVLLNKGELKEC